MNDALYMLLLVATFAGLLVAGWYVFTGRGGGIRAIIFFVTLWILANLVQFGVISSNSRMLLLGVLILALIAVAFKAKNKAAPPID